MNVAVEREKCSSVSVLSSGVDIVGTERGREREKGRERRVGGEDGER